MRERERNVGGSFTGKQGPMFLQNNVRSGVLVLLFIFMGGGGMKMVRQKSINRRRDASGRHHFLSSSSSSYFRVFSRSKVRKKVHNSKGTKPVWKIDNG